MKKVQSREEFSILPSNKVSGNHIWGKHNRKSICGIYKITSPSGKIYIGQSVDILCRWRKYKIRGSVGQTKLHNSFMKYGASNHKFEIIHQCAKECLNNLEEYYMNLFQSKGRERGLNIRNSGSRALHSEESKKLIGDWHRNKFVSDETRAKISMSKKGCKIWSKGVTFSEEHKINMSKSRIGGKHTEEHKLKQSINNAWSKLLLNTETGIYYNTIREAAKTIGMTPSGLSLRLSGNVNKKTSFVYA